MATDLEFRILIRDDINFLYIAKTNEDWFYSLGLLFDDSSNLLSPVSNCLLKFKEFFYLGHKFKNG